jgi:hypothetical protein
MAVDYGLSLELERGGLLRRAAHAVVVPAALAFGWLRAGSVRVGIFLGPLYSARATRTADVATSSAGRRHGWWWYPVALP